MNPAAIQKSQNKVPENFRLCQHTEALLKELLPPTQAAHAVSYKSPI